MVLFGCAKKRMLPAHRNEMALMETAGAPYVLLSPAFAVPLPSEWHTQRGSTAAAASITGLEWCMSQGSSTVARWFAKHEEVGWVRDSWSGWHAKESDASEGAASGAIWMLLSCISTTCPSQRLTQARNATYVVGNMFNWLPRGIAACSVWWCQESRLKSGSR